MRLVRVYDAGPKDGRYRVLVDRLWPRGISKDDLDADAWLKEVAPSDDLRKWFGHDADKWDEFRRRYRAELPEHEDDCRQLVDRARRQTVELVYAARDDHHNNAVVLAEYLEELECRRRWDEGWIVGGHTTPVKDQLKEAGGLWYMRHRVWTMPDRETWEYAQSLLPGEF
ncbi:DUF488 domain-containing protein [Maioricimonas rarisocia]|uniref:DUF488 domain-containing protein n=1 Tax=Maioricimonas rarisocia TaxID=2528026 RepID=UPI0011A5B870|nr:DUF488 family protein [Maioricimonas rarisocia]